MQTVWPVRIVRIDDSSCWVVVVGKLSRMSSSSSGIAKTLADLELLSVIMEVFRWIFDCHMCVILYIYSFVSAVSIFSKLSVHGPRSNVMIYRGICQCCRVRGKAVHLLLIHGYLTDVVPAAHSPCDNSSLTMWNRQHPQHIKRLGFIPQPHPKAHHD